MAETQAARQDDFGGMQASVATLTNQVKDLQAKATEDLAAANVKIQATEANHKSLEDQLVLQHQYGVQCHDALQQATSQLALIHGSTVEASKLTDAQSLLGDSQHLAVDLKGKNEQLMQEVTQKSVELGQIKFQSGKEFLKLKSSIGTLSSQNEALTGNLQTTTKEKSDAEIAVQNLKKQLLMASTTELESRISVLEAEVSHGNEALKNSQLAEASARSQAQQAVAYQHAAEETARLNADAAQKAAQIAQEEVANAAQKTAVAQTDAVQAKAQADASLSEQCDVVWTEKNTDFQKLKEEHATCVADNMVKKAQVKLLSAAAQR